MFVVCPKTGPFADAVTFIEGYTNQSVREQVILPESCKSPFAGLHQGFDVSQNDAIVKVADVLANGSAADQRVIDDVMYSEGRRRGVFGCHGDSTYSVFGQGMDIQSAKNVQWSADYLDSCGPSQEGHPKGESLACPLAAVRMTSLFPCRIESTTLSCQRQGFCPKTCLVSF